MAIVVREGLKRFRLTYDPRNWAKKKNENRDGELFV